MAGWGTSFGSGWANTSGMYYISVISNDILERQCKDDSYNLITAKFKYKQNKNKINLMNTAWGNSGGSSTSFSFGNANNNNNASNTNNTPNNNSSAFGGITK